MLAEAAGEAPEAACTRNRRSADHSMGGACGSGVIVVWRARALQRRDENTAAGLGLLSFGVSAASAEWIVG